MSRPEVFDKQEKPKTMSASLIHMFATFSFIGLLTLNLWCKILPYLL